MIVQIEILIDVLQVLRARAREREKEKEMKEGLSKRKRVVRGGVPFSPLPVVARARRKNPEKERGRRSIRGNDAFRVTRASACVPRRLSFRYTREIALSVDSKAIVWSSNANRSRVSRFFFRARANAGRGRDQPPHIFCFPPVSTYVSFEKVKSLVEERFHVHRAEFDLFANETALERESLRPFGRIGRRRLHHRGPVDEENENDARTRTGGQIGVRRLRNAHSVRVSRMSVLFETGTPHRNQLEEDFMECVS